VRGGLWSLETSGADSSGLTEALPKSSRRNTDSALGTTCRSVGVVYAPLSLSARSDADMQDRVLLDIPSWSETLSLDMPSRSPIASLGEPER
jgi:hypothetical protein